MLENRARPRNNLLTQLIIFDEDVISACGCQTYVLWFNFIFGLNFISLCFWGYGNGRMITSLKKREIKFKPRINYYYSLGTLRNVQIMAERETSDLLTLVEGCLAWNLAQWASEL